MSVGKIASSILMGMSVLVRGSSNAIRSNHEEAMQHAVSKSSRGMPHEHEPFPASSTRSSSGYGELSSDGLKSEGKKKLKPQDTLDNLPPVPEQGRTASSPSQISRISNSENGYNLGKVKPTRQRSIKTETTESSFLDETSTTNLSGSGASEGKLRPIDSVSQGNISDVTSIAPKKKPKPQRSKPMDRMKTRPYRDLYPGTFRLRKLVDDILSVLRSPLRRTKSHPISREKVKEILVDEFDDDDEKSPEAVESKAVSAASKIAKQVAEAWTENPESFSEDKLRVMVTECIKRRAREVFQKRARNGKGPSYNKKERAMTVSASSQKWSRWKVDNDNNDATFWI